MTWIILVGGLLLLALGGELLVRGASALATRLGISALVIGVTIVAMGTSAPEAVVSIIASLQDKPDIAVGNVVGSNIFNVLLILGVCALLSPLVVAQQLIRRDVPIMVGLSAALWIMALDRGISRFEGALLAAAMVAVVIYTLRSSRNEPQQVVAEYEGAQPAKRTGWPVASVMIAAGLGLLVVGARGVVVSAIEISRSLGVDDVVISLTIVAAGTSLPEVATSIIATIRGQRDIAVGNVVGSNIFNIAGILGVSAILSPRALVVADQIERFDIPVMLLVAAVCAPLMISGFILKRWEGALFLAAYALYTGILIWLSAAAEAPAFLSNRLLLTGVPLAALAVATTAWTLTRSRRTATATS